MSNSTQVGASRPRPSPEYLAEDTGYQLLAVGAVMLALQLLAVGGRFAARRLLRQKLGLDDYLILPALLGGIGMCLQAIIAVRTAYFGRHTAWVALNHPQDLWVWARFAFAAELMATPLTITFAKLAILAFFWRLFAVRGGGPARTLRWAIWAVGGFVVAHGVASFFTAMFQCVPVAKIFDFTVPGGRCIDLQAWSFYMSIPNLLSDLALIVMPLPHIWRLQTSKTQKIALTAVFVLAGFNIVASAVRMSIFETAYVNGDPYWTAVPLHSWSVVEAAAAVVAACLPSFYHFFKRAAHHHRSHRSRRAGEKRSGASASLGASPDVSQHGAGGSRPGSRDRPGVAAGPPAVVVNTKRTTPSGHSDPRSAAAVGRIKATTTITTRSANASADSLDRLGPAAEDRWSPTPLGGAAGLRATHEAHAAAATPVSTVGSPVGYGYGVYGPYGYVGGAEHARHVEEARLSSVLGGATVVGEGEDKEDEEDGEGEAAPLSPHLPEVYVPDAERDVERGWSVVSPIASGIGCRCRRSDAGGEGSGKRGWRFEHLHGVFMRDG